MSRLTFGRYSEALDGQLEMQRFYARRMEQVDSRSRSSLSVSIRSGTTLEAAEESYRQLIDKVLPVLEHATPVYVERWIMEMLEDAAADFPTDIALRPNHLPAPAGFAHDSPDRHLEPRWLEPYVKGPDGAPIKDAAKLFAVMR